jgi:hypothetical protein
MAGAEIYNPVTEQFTDIGSLAALRGYHTATRLADGRVLIVGGWNGGAAFNTSAEIFNPSTSTFSLAGSLSHARAYHTSALLHDNRVLIAGGHQPGGVSLTSAEIFDPSTGTFTMAGPMTAARGGPAAASLPTGEVLVAGGNFNLTEYQTSVDVFDPATNLFTPGPSMHSARAYFSATALLDGRALVAGGADSAGSITGAEIFGPAVTFPFTGFYQPIDNAPVVNQVKAGAAVPIKFSLGADRGLAILAAGYPRTQLMQCETGAPIAIVEETVSAGGSSLSYNAATGQYIYVWKTDSRWAGSCRQLQVKLTDGEIYTAQFTFR